MDSTKQEESKVAEHKWGEGTKGWRSVLPIHPAAIEYPRLTAEELEAMSEDVKKNGLRNSVTLYCSGELLDGISRLDALEAAGVRLVRDGKLIDSYVHDGRKRWLYGTTNQEPYAFVASMNAHRRHLSPEVKRERIEALLKKDPQKSDRQIAKEAKVSDHKVVGRARRRLEATGAAPQLTERTGADGKTRKLIKVPTELPPAKAPPSRRGVPTEGQRRAEIEMWQRTPLLGPEVETAKAKEKIAELEHTNHVQATKILGLESDVKDLREARTGADGKTRKLIKVPTRETVVLEDADGKNRKKISSAEARQILTVDTLRDANARQRVRYTSWKGRSSR